MFEGGGPLDEEEPVLLSKPLISSSSGAVAEVVPLLQSAVLRLLAKTPPAAAVARPERSLLADCFLSGDAVEAQTADCLCVIGKYQSIQRSEENIRVISEYSEFQNIRVFKISESKY